MISWRTFGSNMLMLFLLLSFFFIPEKAVAAPALDDSISVSQPDGTNFQVKINGDEFQNWQEDTASGRTVVRNPKDGYWEYAEKALDGTLKNSGLRVDPNGLAVPSHIPPHLMPNRNLQLEAAQQELIRQINQERLPVDAGVVAEGASADFAAGDWTPVPVSGTRKVLVILVNFANRTLVTTAANWYNSVFSTAAGAKSVSNYYKDNSYSSLAIAPVTHTQNGGANPGVVTVTIANNHPNNGGTFNFDLEIAWVNQALAQANPFVNFAALDTNGNGILESSEVSIYFIPAGFEASGTAYTPSIWAHATSGTNLTTIEGKTLNKYAMNGELNGSSRQHPMGVIAHELGHSLCGLPDLYDTSNYNSGLGHFSLMAAGSWGCDVGEDSGTTPTVLDAWSREYLGWAQPQTATGGISLHNALYSRSSAIKLINSSVSSSEYFLAENRYPVGWDLGIRGKISGWTGGLLVTHIDTTIGTFGSNDINKYGVGPHQGVSPEQASTVDCNMLTTTCRGAATTLFYNGNNSSFTDATNPNARYYSGAASGFGLTTISVPGSIMNLTVTNPASPSVCTTPPSISIPAADADGAYTVSWGASATAGASYELQEATNSIFTAGLRTISAGTAQSAAIVGRSQNVTYYYRVRAVKTGFTASSWRTGVNSCAVPGNSTAGVPASITVPAADADGAYTVSWGASTTAGATYELQEATNSLFTVGVRSAYRGTGLSAAITGRSQNVTYYYRVRAVKGGLKDSGYRAGVSSCAVPGTAAVVAPASIAVPAADADGAYTVSWGASTTAGVIYELQEATNSLFTVGVRSAYRGTGLSAAITGRSQSVTYYYRVRAVKGGLKDSGYRAGVNSCAVPGTATVVTPASIAVPAADADGAYTVSWGASTTAGATYELQEATNSLFTVGVRSAYRGTGLSAAITGRSQNVTYYYRVRAVKGGLRDSAYRLGASGCPVPGTATVVAPASIAVPVSDADGAYTVSWGASATAGVTYELQEATNNTFSAGLRVAYRGTGLNCSITGRVSGTTYWYRVRATKAGMKDSVYRTGSNGCTVTISNSLANAMDTSYAVSTGGDANWFYQTAVSYYGGDAAQSGDIADYQSSWMQTTVTGPGFISFYWKVSSESSYDYLRFYIDGIEQPGSISGEVDWTSRSFVLAGGSHVLKWVYSKDGSASSNSDAGWVDKLVFTPGSNSTLVGTWTLNFTWTGISSGSTSLILTSDNRFTTGDGYAGSWAYNGTTFWLYFDTGTTYTSTGTVTGTHMAGTMIDYNGTPGTWTADKQIIGVVAEHTSSAPDGLWSSAGKVK